MTAGSHRSGRWVYVAWRRSHSSIQIRTEVPRSAGSRREPSTARHPALATEARDVRRADCPAVGPGLFERGPPECRPALVGPSAKVKRRACRVSRGRANVPSLNGLISGPASRDRNSEGKSKRTGRLRDRRGPIRTLRFSTLSLASRRVTVAGTRLRRRRCPAWRECNTSCRACRTTASRCPWSCRTVRRRTCPWFRSRHRQALPRSRR